MVQYFVYEKRSPKALGLSFDDFSILLARFYDLKDAELFLKHKRKTAENAATSFYIHPFDDDGKRFIDFDEAERLAKSAAK